MVGKARIQKRLYYKIGEACKALGIQPYVLRYWETEFPALAPSKSRSGQRVYSEKELEIIRRIKELLYEEGYTIAGAKKKLEIELTSGALSEMAEADSELSGTAEIEATPAPVVAAPSPSPRRTRPQPSAPTPESPAAAASSREAAEIQKLRAGIARALQEAREILSLLDA